MGEEKDINVAMELIAEAGDSRSYCMEAIDYAREGQFDEAKEALKSASASMVEAHGAQTDLIREEISGNGQPVSLLMVHAQDHLNLALIMRDIAEELTCVYERLKRLEDK